MLNNYGYNTSPSNGSGSVAVGVGATAPSNNSVALGSNSSATANNSVAIGAGSTASRGAQTNYKDPISGATTSSVGEVSVGSDGADRQITNVAAGSAPTDAANVGQVQAAIAQADAYTDAQFGKASRQTWGVAASAAALANLPQAPSAGQSMIGMSFGASNDEVGFAAGVSYFTRDDNMIVKASASYNAQSGVSGGMGVGFILN
jgi:autotransporter adhesin